MVSWFETPAFNCSWMERREWSTLDVLNRGSSGPSKNRYPSWWSSMCFSSTFWVVKGIGWIEFNPFVTSAVVRPKRYLNWGDCRGKLPMLNPLANSDKTSGDTPAIKLLTNPFPFPMAALSTEKKLLKALSMSSTSFNPPTKSALDNTPLRWLSYSSTMITSYRESLNR